MTRLALVLADVSETLCRVVRGLRIVVAGVDYDSYLAHVRSHHPGTTPLSRSEFEREQNERRGKPGARCC